MKDHIGAVFTFILGVALFLTIVLVSLSSRRAVQTGPAVTCSDEWLAEYRSAYAESSSRHKEIECRTLRALESIAESLRERSE